MAISYPLSLADFYGGLRVVNCTFDLPGSMEESGTTGAGEVLTADVGTRLWTGEVTLSSYALNAAEAVNSAIEALAQSGRSFLIYNSRKPFPAGDPNGALLTGFTPTLKAVAGNLEPTLQGLPEGLVLSRGDMLGFAYGADPTRLALHRIFNGATVDEDGEAKVELTSFVRPGWAVGAPVTLIRAVCKAHIIKGSHGSGTTVRDRVNGIKFSWQQTLR